MKVDAVGAGVRASAARVVHAVVSQGQSMDVALRAADAETSAADRPLLRMLCYGVLRRHWQLRSQVAALLDKPLPQKDRIIESLLSVGLFQLSDSRVPPHASVSLTVEAARLLRRPKYAGVLNACLRNFQRRGPALQSADDDEARFNHPQWLIDRLKRDWPGDWQKILEANSTRAAMWLRVNRRRRSTTAYAELLAANCTLLPGFPQAIRLAEPRPAAELPGFGDGLVSVQDAAAQLAAPWLLTDGGERVLDACAAPGGKTGHLLELLPPEAVLTAVDANPDRLAVAGENLERLGLSARLLCADAGQPEDWWDGKPFDRILLDAPCSATGVIRRHPDIPLLRRADDIDAVAVQQRQLLSALWRTLAPGGRLLYVTCSVLPEENEAVVGDFLRRQPGAEERSLLPDYNIRDVMRRRACGYQILPGDRGLDGFFYACLGKRA